MRVPRSLMATALGITLLCGCSALQMGELPVNGSNSDGTVQEHTEWESTPGILRRYNSAYVDQIDVLSGDSGRLVAASADEITDLTTGFRSQIVRALGDKYAVLPVPSRGVAIIKVQLLNICSTRALPALRPGLVIPNTFRGGGTMEATFYDSVTGAEIARIVDSRVGQRQGFFSGLGKWDGIERSFTTWSAMLARQIP